MRDAETIRAGFGVRAAAFVVDRALLFLALGTIRLPAALSALFGAGGLAAESFLFQYTALDVLCWLLSAVYFVLLTYFTGSTLGKKLLRIRVMSASGAPLRFIDVLYRETVGRFLSGIMYIGYVMALADGKRRAFHDWLCDTCVVYDERIFRAAPGAPSQPAPEAAPVSAPEALPAPNGYGYSVPGETTEKE